jgi:hypothetical protein
MQMANTRRNTYEAAETWGNGAGAGGGGSGHNINNNEPHPKPHLPPPPPLTPEMFFAQLLGSQRNAEQSQKNMEDFLRTIANNVQRGNHQGGGNGANQYSNFKDFMDTKPPIFKEAAEPLDAEEWINTMEDKFRLLRLTEVLKTEYAAHQLQGPAGMWWKHHRTTFPPNAQISWREFTEAFRGVYIPQGLTEMKLGEFLALNQGTKTVTQYLHAFNNLCRYAPDMVDTDAKRIASFKRGLSPKMLKHVGTNNRTRFTDFISDCLKQEKNNNAYAASKTRKRALETGASQLRAPMANRPTYRPSAPGARFQPPQQRGQNFRGPQKPYKMAIQPAKTTASAGQGSSKGAVGSAGTVRGPCYNYDQPGHFSRFCPYPSKKKQQTYPARVHHTTVDEIPEGEPVTAGKFSINQHPAVVLFDSGSSHSFMSQAFAQKYEQQCTELGYGYRISSAGADVLTNKMVRGVTLDLGGRIFRVNLLIMPGLVLDVIIGMNWMQDWGAVIDTGSRVLTLKDPQGEGTFQVPLP